MFKPWKTFPLRLACEDHGKMVEAAKVEGLSLEKFILIAINEKIDRQQGGLK
jgi:predicted HicB family RNase H-like nuclease